MFLDGLKNIKKISFDAPFSGDSEYHNRNLIAIRERSEKKLFCRGTSATFDPFGHSFSLNYGK